MRLPQYLKLLKLKLTTNTLTNFNFREPKILAKTQIMKTFITLLTLFFLQHHLFAQTETPITLETKTGVIHGTLLTPNTEGKTPIVLIISGSGPTDKNGNLPIGDNNSLKMLAEGLQKQGIASLRYDKRGIAESIEARINEAKLRFDHYINDTKAWIELLKKDSRFSEIIVLGHSQGSLIGIIASQETGVNRFISVAGTGKPAAEIMKEQLKAQPPAIADQALPILEKITKGETVNNIPASFYSLFRPNIQAYLVSWFKYNPTEEIQKLDIPVLILQGTTDLQVPIEDAELLAKSGKNVQKKIIPGMNHILKDAPIDRTKNFETYTKPELPLTKGLIEVISTFIKS